MKRNRLAAVVWKEWTELLRLDQGLRSVGVRVVGAGILGVVLAWRTGSSFGHDRDTILLLVQLTLLPTLPITPDSFAGERERHTLETLLATPIKEAELFLGKFIAILGFGVAFASLVTVLNAFVVAVRYGLPAVLRLSYGVLATGLGIGLLSAAILTGVGLILSVHVRSVRTANQISAYSLVALIFAGSAVSRSLPASLLATVTDWTKTAPPQVQAVTILLVLALAAIAVLMVGIATFNRERLFEGD